MVCGGKTPWFYVTLTADGGASVEVTHRYLHRCWKSHQ